jgi:predicted acetyltransferase
MKYHFRELKHEELIEFLKLGDRVYPRFALPPDEKEKVAKRYKEMIDEGRMAAIVALDENEKIVGRLLLINYLMNFRGKMVKMGGIGGVGVDLPNKKQHVCRDMIKFSLNFLLEKGINCSALYPFRADFYKKMGYGLLTPFYKYRLPTDRFRKNERSPEVKYLSEVDSNDMAELYDEHFRKTNGETDRRKQWAEKVFKDGKNIIVGYRKEGKLVSYAICKASNIGEDNFMRYDLSVREFVSVSPEGSSAIMGFFRNQLDQFESVEIHTQDEDFYYNFDNPADVNRILLPNANHSFSEGRTGMMFRILDIEKFFGEVSEDQKNEGDSVICTFNVDEPFLAKKKYRLTLEVSENGIKKTDSKGDLEVDVSMEDFSPMIFGAVSLEKLYEYDLIKCSDVDLMRKCSKYLSSCEKPTYHANF